MKLAYKLGQFVTDMQVSDPVSVTVPDDAEGIRDILTKYANGIMPMGREGYYDGDIFIPDLSSLDLTELAELREESLRVIEEQEALHAEYSRKLAEKEAEDRFEQELEKRMSSKKDIDASGKQDA